MNTKYLYIVAFFAFTSIAIANETQPSKEVMAVATQAYQRAKSNDISQSALVTIIDYSLPATEKRLWVVDMKNHHVLKNTRVSHGHNSGILKAKSFSNKPGSHQSSLGIYLTGDSYVGKKGYSMRLYGLDKGFNDLAAPRGIIMHGAPYVHDECHTNNLQCVGRSFGCLAVSFKNNREVIDMIKAGSLLVAYYPDPRWLSQSSFLV